MFNAVSSCVRLKFKKIYFFFPNQALAAQSSLKGAFKEASQDTSNEQTEETGNPPKKKIKLGGVLCNAASGCSSRALFKNDASKTMFCKEHYELLPKPAKRACIKLAK